MAKVEKFGDLGVWQLAREICKDISQLFNETELSQDYALKNQVNRSSGSIMDNIAEGFERNGNKGFIQFLSIAKASCGELRSQLYQVVDRNYINQEQFEKYQNTVLLESKKISAFINYLINSELKGSKYNRP